MADLEKKLKTLEVSGLWSLPGRKERMTSSFFLFCDVLFAGTTVDICKGESSAMKPPPLRPPLVVLTSHQLSFLTHNVCFVHL